MAKLGKPYENLMALVAKALHPGAAIEVGEWVEGPDVAREIDVTVRGQIDDKQTFILIECKDWQSDVGIAEIDALDSKRQDLNADKTMIVSNSGFTEPALMKARRKGIMCVSALAAGNDTVRFVRSREFVAKKLSVERYSYKVYGDCPEELKLEELKYDDKKLVAWLRDRSLKLLRENEFATVIHHGIMFKGSVQFLIGRTSVLLRGIDLHLECRRSWVAQTIREDVSHGIYDHLKDTVLVPNKEYLSMEFDSRNWHEIAPEGEPEICEPETGTIQFGMVLFNPIFGSEHGPAPLLEDLIDKEVTEFGQSGL